MVDARDAARAQQINREHPAQGCECAAVNDGRVCVLCQARTLAIAQALAEVRAEQFIVHQHGSDTDQLLCPVCRTAPPAPERREEQP